MAESQAKGSTYCFEHWEETGTEISHIKVPPSSGHGYIIEKKDNVWIMSAAPEDWAERYKPTEKECKHALKIWTPARDELLD